MCSCVDIVVRGHRSKPRKRGRCEDVDASSGPDWLPASASVVSATLSIGSAFVGMRMPCLTNVAGICPALCEPVNEEIAVVQ
jgi:hypothetical protein